MAIFAGHVICWLLFPCLTAGGAIRKWVASRDINPEFRRTFYCSIKYRLRYRMNSKTRWRSRSRVLTVTSMVALFSLLTHGVAAGVNDDLIKAAEHGDTYELKSIITAGGDINARDNKSGMTALMVASEEGHLAVVQALIARGADVNATTREGWTALLAASQGGDLKIVQALIMHGADVNAMTTNHWTALMAASEGGHS